MWRTPRALPLVSSLCVGVGGGRKGIGEERRGGKGGGERGQSAFHSPFACQTSFPFPSFDCPCVWGLLMRLGKGARSRGEAPQSSVPFFPLLTHSLSLNVCLRVYRRPCESLAKGRRVATAAVGGSGWGPRRMNERHRMRWPLSLLPSSLRLATREGRSHTETRRGAMRCDAEAHFAFTVRWLKRKRHPLTAHLRKPLVCLAEDPLGART